MTQAETAAMVDGDAPPTRHVLGMRVDATSYADATRHIMGWAETGRSSYVCVANVHMTMEAWDDADFRGMVNGADLVVPDGMPLVWTLRALGVGSATRVRGPDLVRWLAADAAARGMPIGLYGGAPDVARAFTHVLQERYPGLDVRLAISPPYRTLAPEEQRADLQRLGGAGVRLVFVGLGCPKQERWMATHHRELPAVMVGVGAAFDFFAGSSKEAPRWMQRAGLEWLFRLSQEPRRLWRRYAWHNPRFLWHVAGQILRSRLGIEPPVR